MLAADTSNNQVVLGQSGHLDGQLAFASTTGSTVTLVAGSTTASYTLTLPTTVGTSGQCLELGSGANNPLQFASCGSGASGLAKNAADSSGASVTTSQAYLYQFSNTNTGVASSVLLLNNNNNTNAALAVTASAAPGSGQALISGSIASSTPSGNLLSLQAGASPTSVFTVSTNNSEVGTATISAGGTYTSAGTVTFSSGGANAINIDTGTSGVGANINIAPTNATEVTVGKPFILNDAGNAFQDSQAPTGAAADSLINLVTAGATFTGSSSGTYIGVAAASGYAGDLIDLQLNGTIEFSVDAQGNVTQGNGYSIYDTGSNAFSSAGTGNYTLTTSDMLLERFVYWNPATANAFTLTTPSASSIVTALGVHAAIGDTFSFVVDNYSAKNESPPLTAGSGVTLTGVTPSEADSTVTVVCRVTNVSTPAVTCY